MRATKGASYSLPILLLAGSLAFTHCSKAAKPAEIIIDVNPLSITFPAIPVGQTAEQVVTIKHIGKEGILRLKKIRWEEGSSPEFTFTPPPVESLQPGEATTMKVIYQPKDSSPDNGTLVIEHNAPPYYVTKVSVASTAQTGSLTTDPSPIDFGEVRGGNFKDLVVKVINVGTDFVQIRKAPYFSSDSSQDFTIEGEIVTPENKSFPFDLWPGEAIEMTLTYRPQNGGEDLGTLVVEAVFKGDFQLVQFPVRGREVGPHLVVSPGIIDFGLAQLGETKEVVVTIDNAGYSSNPLDSLLVIPAKGISLSEDSDEGLSLVEDGLTPASAIPASDWTIKAEEYKDHPDVASYPEMMTFTVRWKADHPRPDDGLPIGRLLVSSNDQGSGLVTVEIYGRIAVPMIDVLPNPVDFGTVALGIESTRTVTIINNGNGPLKFTGPLTIEDDQFGEFSIVPDDSFPPTKPDFDPATQCPDQGDNSGCTIGPKTSKEVTLKFKNTQGPTGDVLARLVVRSNAFNTPEMKVDLVARRAASPTCVPKLAPPNLNFGTVLQGTSAKRTMFLVNEGTGYCSFKDCQVYDCPTLATFITQCQKGFGQSQYFKIVSGKPPAVLNGMGPGQTFPMEVQFDAPKGEFMFTVFYGLLTCQVYDSYKQETVEVPAKQSGFGGEGYPVNLTATLGYNNIVVTPLSIDFGKQRVGCASVPRKVTIRNTGNAPLTLKKVSFYKCTPEFKEVTPLPPADTLINPSKSLEIEVHFVPQDDTDDTCYLRIESNDLDEPLVFVKLHGMGTFEQKVTDRFKQVSGNAYDLLIVLDDCACTMMAFGEYIKDAINKFISSGAIWDQDFHVGLITMLIDDKKKRGRLCEGNPSIQPRFVATTTPDPKGKFKNIYDKVTEEYSSDSLTKGGLLASYLAVTEPLSVKTDVPCTSHGDCLGNATICPDPATCDMECVDGFCGGYNWGFYRPEAYLDIVYISKTDDDSPGTLNDYRDLLDTIKGPMNRQMIHLHSVTYKPYCQTQWPGAEGKRYEAISKEFGGQQAVICEDFSPLLNQIGLGQGGKGPLKTQFFLSSSPVQGTLQVKVAGQVCTSGWSYDSVGNSIVFDPAGPCMPTYSQDIEVSYEVYCGS